MIRLTALFQGVYYFLTGLWAMVGIDSFMKVTGPKYDVWLVKMVGLLTISISSLLLIVGVKNKLTLESAVLILAACTSYASIDIYYVLAGRINTIYLADALVEIALLIIWIIVLLKQDQVS